MGQAGPGYSLHWSPQELLRGWVWGTEVGREESEVSPAFWFELPGRETMDAAEEAREDSGGSHREFCFGDLPLPLFASRNQTLVPIIH